VSTTILSQYGGRFLARGGSIELIEGGPELRPTIVIVEIRRQGGVQAFLLFTRIPENPAGLARQL
jgi:uncharacterized protein (DUF1330 family)